MKSPFFLALPTVLLSLLAAPPVEGADRPRLVGDWWPVANNPDLGDYTSPRQQPVDFGIWQAADGTWQIWSCIRHTECGGHTRLFHRWEGKNLTDSDWQPMGIAMEADVSLGEQKGGLQAPHVFKVGDVYKMIYGDWRRICLAESRDGKLFERVLNENGQPDLFTGPYGNSRDPLSFGVNDDRYRIGTLPVAAPEIIHHEGQWYIAALKPALDGIRIARLEWREANH